MGGIMTVRELLITAAEAVILLAVFWALYVLAACL